MVRLGVRGSGRLRGVVLGVLLHHLDVQPQCVDTMCTALLPLLLSVHVHAARPHAAHSRAPVAHRARPGLVRRVPAAGKPHNTRSLTPPGPSYHPILAPYHRKARCWCTSLLTSPCTSLFTTPCLLPFSSPPLLISTITSLLQNTFIGLVGALSWSYASATAVTFVVGGSFLGGAAIHYLIEKPSAPVLKKWLDAGFAKLTGEPHATGGGGA